MKSNGGLVDSLHPFQTPPVLQIPQMSRLLSVCVARMCLWADSKCGEEKASQREGKGTVERFEVMMK